MLKGLGLVVKMIKQTLAVLLESIRLYTGGFFEVT